jgi:nucleoside-diphosphate-sugar epimerase
MKVFVTGGTGFIGGNLIKRLLKEGASVKALVRDQSKAEEFERLGVRSVIGDITDKTSIKGVLKDCEIFFHLGNVSQWWVPDKSLYYRVNVEGTQNIMLEALKEDVRKVVYTSSLAAIRQPGGTVTTEEMEHQRDFESHYGRSKFLAEEVILRLYRERGLPAVILNLGVVIGPGDLKTFGRTIIELLGGKLKARLFEESVIPLVYIDDVIEGLMLAAENGRTGEKYILVGDNVSIRYVFELVNEITGVSIPDRRMPPSLMKLIAYFLEARALFTEKPPKFSTDGIRAMEIGASGANRKAREELQLNFTPLEQALRRTIAWYKEKAYVL